MPQVKAWGLYIIHTREISCSRMTNAAISAVPESVTRLTTFTLISNSTGGLFNPKLSHGIIDKAA